MKTTNLLGIGIYGISEAARITQIPPEQIRRWLWGYRYSSSGRPRQAPPLWRPGVPQIGETHALSFRDLVEVQFVHRFRQKGLSLQSIRTTIDLAAKLLDETYPLSSVKFKTDGKRILAQVIEDPQERGVVFDLETGQYLFEFVLDYLYDALEYSDFDELVRWWPLGKDRRVLVDPRKSFGRAIVTEGVPTAILAGSFRAEGSVADVARWFEVSEDSVRDALELERDLQAA
jgi:DNA-binding transcriptional MerR regulator/uncharacterized protein (DUF433 family)